VNYTRLLVPANYLLPSLIQESVKSSPVKLHRELVESVHQHPQIEQ